MHTVINIVIGIVIFFIVGSIFGAIADDKHEREARIQQVKNEFNQQKVDFDGILSGFFTSIHGSYQGTYSSLKRFVSNMESTNKELMGLTKYYNFSGIISRCSKLADDFNSFGQQVKSLPETRMMDSANYGRIQKVYWDSIRSMNKSIADTIIADFEGTISSHDYPKILAIDIDTILRCVWFYATDKPYSAESFKKAVNLFNCFVENEHIDIIIAELYAMKQMGGEDVLRDRIRNILKAHTTIASPLPGSTYMSAEELTLIASALMWINAYQAENMILQHMLSAGMQMPAKTQERLHSLTNGGGKAPSGFNVVSSENVIYFDVSALAWKDDEYTGLFENLAFQEKTLSYSLAVRDEDKELFIRNGINVPDTPAIFNKFSSVFLDEYGSTVTATMEKCIALSGSGEENIEGILVESNECKQMGILVHVARIGKKLNIKFYTLFMPSGTRLADQKQQVLSLYKKLSPSIAMWESSMKDTVLMAIQQLLNAEPQSTFSGGESSGDSNDPIF